MASSSEKRKETHRLSEKRRNAINKNKGLCLSCGKEKAQNGLRRCPKCNNHRNHLQRQRRERISAKIIDDLIDRDLVTASEAGEMLGVCRGTVTNNYIKKGLLHVRSKRSFRGGITFWVSEIEVFKLISQMRPNIRCTKCDHFWHTNLAHPKNCPRLGCRSVKLERIPLKNTHYKRSVLRMVRLSKADIKKMVEDRLHGKTVTNICKEFGICVKTFYRYWREYNKEATSLMMMQAPVVP